jgi:DNA-binding MarR family transcriptional regulator
MKVSIMKFKIREKLIGRWISIVNRYTQIYFSNELKPYEMSTGQGIPFVELFSNEGKSQDELASLIKINKATMTRSLIKLEKKGYIFRKTDPSDNRVKRVYLTDKAKNFAPTFLAIFNAWAENLVRNFSREEKEQLLSFLERMGQNAIDMSEKQI